MMATAAAGAGTPPDTPSSSISLDAPAGTHYHEFVRTWTDAHVQRWLQDMRCGHLASHFRANDLRSDVLLELEHATLREIGVASIGDRVRVLAAVKALRARCAAPREAPRRPAPLQLPTPTRPLPSPISRRKAPTYTNQPLPPAPAPPASAAPPSWAPSPYGLPADPRNGKPAPASPLPHPPPRGASFSPGFAPSRSPAIAHGRNLSASSAVVPPPPPKQAPRPATANNAHPYAVPPGVAAVANLSPITEAFSPTSGFAVGRGPFANHGAPRPTTPSLVDLRRKLIKFTLAEEGHSATINVADCAGGVEVLERALKKFGKLHGRAVDRAGTDDGGLAVDGWTVYLDGGALTEAQLLAVCHSNADDPARERGLTLRRTAAAHARSQARARALASLGGGGSEEPATTPPLSPLLSTNPDLEPDAWLAPPRPNATRRASTLSVLSGLGVPFPEKASDALENDRPLSPASPAPSTALGGAFPTKQARRASATVAKVRNFFGQRPPSELIVGHLKEYFPTADRRMLKRTSVLRTGGPPAGLGAGGRRDSTWSFHPAQGGPRASRFSVSTASSAGRRLSTASTAPSLVPRAGMDLPQPDVRITGDDGAPVPALPPVEFPREPLLPDAARRLSTAVTEVKSARAKKDSDAASMRTVDEITERVATRRTPSVRASVLPPRSEADTQSIIDGWTHVAEEGEGAKAEIASVTPTDVPVEGDEEEDDTVEGVDASEYDEDEYDGEEGEDEEDEEEDEEELDDDDEEEEEEDEEDETGRAETSGDIKWIKGALIGSGSFGQVYLGMDATNGLLMAVKQVALASSLAADRRAAMVAALEREIALLKDLQHEHIVQYLYSSADEQHFNIFLEYVPGGSVAALLRNYGAFEEPLVRNFVRQILQGLDYVHERGIVHRDLKGANVLVDNKGGIKISDFGVSKKLEDNLMPGNRLHRPSLQGSVFWMAPEVVKQTAYTKKADIWSVGCLVVEMFTGDHPWAQLNQMQAIFKIGAGNAPPPIPRDISAAAQAFLVRCFELDHEARPGAGELLQHAWLQKKPAGKPAAPGGMQAKRDALAAAAAAIIT